MFCENNDSEKIYPLMSITKIMTCIVASNILGEHQKMIIINKNDIKGGSGITLKPFDKLSIDDAYKAVLISSLNTVSYALARIAGKKLFEQNEK